MSTGDGDDHSRPSSGCAASGAKPGKRLKTKNLTLKSIFDKGKKKLLKIQFEQGENGTYVAVGPHSDNFNTLVGTIISKIPYHYHTWKDVESEHTCTIIDELQEFYDLQSHLDGSEGKLIKAGLELYFASIYRGQKFKFGQKYFVKRGGVEKEVELRASPPPDYPAAEWSKFMDYRMSEKFLSRSRANKANKEKRVVKVRIGRKNLAEIRFDNRDVSAIDLWKKYRSKDGQFIEDEAARLHAQMTSKKADPNNKSSDQDIVQNVLGERRGWIRGVGQKLPKSVLAAHTSSSSTKKRKYTDDDLFRIMQEYTAPIFQKLNMTPPPLIIPEDVDSQEEEDDDDDGDSDENEVGDDDDDGDE